LAGGFRNTRYASALCTPDVCTAALVCLAWAITSMSTKKLRANHLSPREKSLAPEFNSLAFRNIQDHLAFAVPAINRQPLRFHVRWNALQLFVSQASGTHDESVFLYRQYNGLRFALQHVLPPFLTLSVDIHKLSRIRNHYLNIKYILLD
jgi:hypothetical protein